jgi:ribosome maturation factor RimP
MEKMVNTQEIEEFLSASAEKEGFEVIDVCYVKEDGRWILRIFIDKESHIVSMNDCEKASRFFSDILDEKDIIKDSYILEVSSPGTNRVLKKEKHFKEFIKKEVRIQTLNSVNDQKNFLGELVDVIDGKVVLNDVTNGRVEICIDDIRRANVEDLF